MRGEWRNEESIISNEAEDEDLVHAGTAIVRTADTAIPIARNLEVVKTSLESFFVLHSITRSAEPHSAVLSQPLECLICFLDKEVHLRLKGTVEVVRIACS